MSSKQASSKQVPEKGSAAGDAATDGLAEAKAKMRAALDRKNAGHHPSAEGVRHTGPVGGADVGSDAKRTFQPRKTG